MRVLILVVVEDVLVHGCKDYSYSSLWVLILVVVEDVLVLRLHQPSDTARVCLNPCCGGRCSSTMSRELTDDEKLLS